MKNETIYNSISLACGTWFLVTGTVWSYGIALVAGLPVALVGLFFWYRAAKINSSPTNKVALVLLLIGLVASIVSFFFYK